LSGVVSAMTIIQPRAVSCSRSWRIYNGVGVVKHI
jgi:hypothetical protein